ncbi:OmpA family protein [Lewinella sp. JB7]|uniref:OmpA family protein n=1 Tax=Lewinella sp. JB7 TaxID=2962887 RepID=UPI0020C9DA3A|nr:OmpA family protein [Lewinella sp. JB7]MCP9234448.1 OmpA family protein [Lewinella sp. JB7]
MIRTTLLAMLTLSLFPQLSAQTEERRDTVVAAAESDTRTRYAKDMAELERMKEKFRKQQEEKQRRRDGTEGLSVYWEAEPEAGPAVISERDTAVLRSTVRSGLYPDQRPAAYERRRWENTISDNLPPEGAATDAEAEALRAKLRDVRGEPTERTAKSPVSAAIPATPTPAGSVTFIPNTAYPNSAGYAGLDALTDYVKKSNTVVEIRVHTSRQLDARAAQLLSEERATTIRQHLIEAGIARENFRVVGYGNHQSAAGERVEIVE